MDRRLRWSRRDFTIQTTQIVFHLRYVTSRDNSMWRVKARTKIFSNGTMSNPSENRNEKEREKEGESHATARGTAEWGWIPSRRNAVIAHLLREIDRSARQLAAIDAARKDVECPAAAAAAPIPGDKRVRATAQTDGGPRARHSHLESCRHAPAARCASHFIHLPPVFGRGSSCCRGRSAWRVPPQVPI